MRDGGKEQREGGSGPVKWLPCRNREDKEGRAERCERNRRKGEERLLNERSIFVIFEEGGGESVTPYGSRLADGGQFVVCVQVGEKIEVRARRDCGERVVMVGVVVVVVVVGGRKRNEP